MFFFLNVQSTNQCFLADSSSNMKQQVSTNFPLLRYSSVR